jgi:two-component system chemotaxis sensor kinase CheA
MAARTLGDILVEQGVIDRDALDRALRLQHRRLGQILIEEQLADPVAIANALKFQARFFTPSRSNSLSVEVRILDDLLRRFDAIEERALATSADALATAAVSVARDTIESILLSPIEGMFQKAKLVVARASQELGKQVKFTAEGDDLVIDRSVLGELSDIVLHLVRNAVAHGIEIPEQRQNIGKSETGEISMQVRLHGGKLVATVSDDGQGVDLGRVYEKAVELKLTEKPRAELTEEEIYRFLFTPGFSTAERVSNVSGRGVGLDVVEATAIRLGGNISIHSSQNQGASFSVVVPLPYAKIFVIPLRIGAEWFAVPAADIAKIEKRDTRAESDEQFQSAASLLAGNSVSEPLGIVVRYTDGTQWVFHETGQSEYAMVREAGPQAKGLKGIIGSTRISGRSMLLIDLQVFSGSTIDV